METFILPSVTNALLLRKRAVCAGRTTRAPEGIRQGSSRPYKHKDSTKHDFGIPLMLALGARMQNPHVHAFCCASAAASYAARAAWTEKFDWVGVRLKPFIIRITMIYCPIIDYIGVSR